MKLLILALLGVGALVGVVLAAFVIGLFLPRTHEESGERELAPTPPQVWEKITAFEDYPEWQPALESVERLSGAGPETVIRQKRRDSRQPLTLAVETWEPNKRLVLRTADADLPFSGTWDFELTPHLGGTKLKITERGEIANPGMRTMWRLFRPSKGRVAEFLEAM
jgi:uncharacterized protein YndB with AHSA1/START domain